MPGFINNIAQNSSTLISDTVEKLKEKFKFLTKHTYENYYLKLATAHYVYFNDFHKNNYIAEKQNIIIDKKVDHLSSIALFLFPIMPITENPASITTILPILKIIAALDSWFINAHSLAWIHNTVNIIGLDWLTSFTIPIALMTALSFHRVLLLPRAENDRSKISLLDIMLIISLFALTIMIPITFQIISLIVCSYYLITRFFCIPQNYLRLQNFNSVAAGHNFDNKGPNHPVDNYVYAEDITLGFDPDQDELNKIKDITVTKRERQIYSMCMKFFLTNLTLMLSSKLQYSMYISIAPMTIGIHISLISIIGLTALILPLFSYYNDGYYQSIEDSFTHVKSRQLDEGNKRYYDHLQEMRAPHPPEYENETPHL
jgi:hypothetical protein